MRALLWVGFGGLLGLLTFIGINTFSAVGQVQVRNERIPTEYLARAALLERLRSEMYLSGTYVRDFLLETDEHKADVYRQEFFASRTHVLASVRRYRQIIRPEENGAFESLSAGLKEYFDALQPALQWNVAQRE